MHDLVLSANVRKMSFRRPKENLKRKKQGLFGCNYTYTYFHLLLLFVRENYLKYTDYIKFQFNETEVM